MAKLNITLSFVLLFFLCFLHKAKSGSTEATNFIQAECRTTRYPALCVQCLSNYSSSVQLSQRQLAQAALSVSLSRAQLAASFVYKLAKMKGMKVNTVYASGVKESRAVKDCTDNMGDTVDQLSRATKELGAMGRVAGQNFEWRVSNVQTWVSAALTNENMCLGGFAGPAMDGNIKYAIRRRVVNCVQVTSNALALVNSFAARHK